MDDIKVLQLENATEIEKLEKQWLAAVVEDENDREIMSWHASWRKESLDHYLPLGWSFGIWQNSRLVGYFISQPVLFMAGLTQVLWVERLAAQSPEVTSGLIDIAYKICREKNLQKAIFHIPEKAPQSPFQLRAISDILYELKTAKY